MQYTVKLDNIADNDQLVLRLIFSLSEKARGREHAFQLAQPESDDVDICIAHADKPVADQTIDVILVDNQNISADEFAYQIRKPLIASRVLSVLDRFVREQPPQHQNVETQEQILEAGEDALDFCISEEEASELAIVDDESLANPSNQQTNIQNRENPLSAPAVDKAETKVTSLTVRHKNTEREVSALAFQHRSETLAATTRPRALVVDDSRSVLKQIELELDLFNVDVDFADSVDSANSQLRQQHYDVAFLDVVLPDGDGFGICRSIKSNSKETRVIMLTGKATAADKIKGTMAGCDAYLVKPVGRMTFQNTVCQYLQLREQLEVIHG